MVPTALAITMSGILTLSCLGGPPPPPPAPTRMPAYCRIPGYPSMWFQCSHIYRHLKLERDASVAPKSSTSLVRPA